MLNLSYDFSIKYSANGYNIYVSVIEYLTIRNTCCVVLSLIIRELSKNFKNILENIAHLVISSR